MPGAAFREGREQPPVLGMAGAAVGLVQALDAPLVDQTIEYAAQDAAPVIVAGLARDAARLFPPML